mmetsp:Transcript_9684/g.29858  ORF Transcript_9684/g.29858 Transcript_9684/m.29858 type:complete len:284 (+) Transcript_9684:82-933(+)
MASEDKVIEIEVHSGTATSPPIKKKLEKDASTPKRSAAEQAAELERAQAKAALIREAKLEQRMVNAHEEVEHAKEVHQAHRQRLEQERDQLLAYLQSKQEFAAFLREDLLEDVRARAAAEVDEARRVALYSETMRSLKRERLQQAIERSQKLAQKNRDTLQSYRSALAAFEVEHAHDVADAHAKHEEFVTELLETSLEREQALAAHLRSLHEQTVYEKAHAEVQHAQEVAAKAKEAHTQESKQVSKLAKHLDEVYCVDVADCERRFAEHTRTFLDFTPHHLGK